VIEFNKPGTNGPVIRPVEASDSSSPPTIPADGAGTGPVSGSSARPDADRSRPSGKSDEGATRKEAVQVSPIFLDSTGQPRALPGGVIVSFRQELPEAQARARLEESGLTPRRQLGPRMWLVDSPVGVASLDLAERLQGDERFEFAQPNWWRPRATK
jgi:hypothetical protein